MLAAGALALVALSVAHLLQGSAAVSVAEVVRAALTQLPGAPGAGEDAAREQAVAVLLASRLPRLAAAVLCGVALGLAGTLLQSVSRNALASPDTVAVNAGAYVAVAVVAVTGVSLPFYAGGLVAFAGGLAAALLVLVVARIGADDPVRLVLAGSAVALALGSLTSVLLLLFPQDTLGLYAWGSGSTAQGGPDAVLRAAPVVVVGALAVMLLCQRLDVMGLGEDAARSLGVPVGRTRLLAVVGAVLLSAVAVTLAGPIGFVGLCAPVLARLLARGVPGLAPHARLLPLAALTGALVVVAADVLLRLLVPADVAANVPTGVVTSLAGAVLLVHLARRLGVVGAGGAVSGTVGGGTVSSSGTLASRRRVLAVAAVTATLLVATALAALLLGERVVLLGDVANWAQGLAGRQVSFALDQRVPRVGAALLGGACLALAGCLVQAVCRNPLAEPGLLGITPGASAGAVAVVLLVPGVGVWPVMGVATAVALVAFALVLRLAAGRAGLGGGLPVERVLLVGIGVSTAAGAVTTLVVLLFAPWSPQLALTWLAGSTWGRSGEQLLPAAGALLVGLPAALLAARVLDLLSLDDDVPRLLGVRLGRARLGLLALAGVLTAAAACAVGALGFVGLVAPHAARALVGGRHALAVPVAVGLGALLVCAADLLGRTLLSPTEVAAGLVTALLGAPYFVYLLRRSATSR